jgi:hypothetical protein
MTLENSFYFGLFTGFKICLIISIIIISWEGNLNPNDPDSNLHILYQYLPINH